MPAQLLDGKALAKTLLEELRHEVAALREQDVVPGLAIVDASGDKAAQQYIARKRDRAEALGFHVAVFPFDPSTRQEALTALVARLNVDPGIHGIIIEQPFAAHLDPQPIWAAIAPEKDVDGANPASQGLLALGMPRYVPATALGCVTLLERYGVAIGGKHAVVVGRSPVVGRPVVSLLLQRDATVTVCHRQTVNLAYHTRQADVLIVAAGRAGLVGGDMIKPGAAVVDVGTNVQNGRTVGDVRFDEALSVAGYVTPVPGGVGPLTTAMLLHNTLRSAKDFALRLSGRGARG